MKAWTQCPYFVKVPNFRKFEKLGSAQLREKFDLKSFEISSFDFEVGSSQLSAMCPKISVSDLYGVSNSIQIRGMYIIFMMSENFVSKRCS